MNEVNPKLHFNPDLHPDNTLKKFKEFMQTYHLRYEVQYQIPQKVALKDQN